ncbi:MAG: hypothetical protein IH587_12070 [Anaerolineae bacterium]|nr:hypothetical protein [Anaerolineae bacterium]
MFINVLGTVIMFFIFTESIANMPAASEILTPAQANELRTMVSSFTLVSSVIVGVISAVGSAISLFVQVAAIHFVATRMFQGKGTMRYMLDNLFALYNKRLPLLYGLSIASVWITFGAGAPIFTALLGFVTAIIGLRILFKASSLTSEAYNFGGGSGCLTNVFAFGFLWLITAVIGYFLGSTVFGSFLSGMGNIPIS